MINKKLVSYLKEDKKYVYLQVLMQWLALLSQIIIVAIMANMINELFIDQKINNLAIQVIIIIILIFVKGYFGRQATMYSFKAAKNIKGKLRVAVYKKILALNNHYSEVLSMASLTQLMSEGVEQLETYFGKYLPQFFYSMLAPITLFIVLCQVDFKAALVLFICVPLIPLSIVLVQKFAKRLLSKYWGLYGNLAERFLDNVSGLTTLKGYCGDASKHQEMNEEAQRFRSITMKVLVMQLNSISIMDLVAYGGAALGIIFSLLSYYDNKIDLGQTFMMIMLSAEFFIPLRLLGSFFHIAMNGNAASEKIFKLLDTPVSDNKTLALGKINEIELSNLTFAYKQDNVLENINLKINEPGIYGVVGSSGSGKSTIAKLLLGYFDHYQGSLTYNGLQVKEINHHDLMKQITLVEHNPYIFAGTVRSNLLDGNCYASDEQLMAVLEKVNLLNYFKELDGLDSEIEERGNNLSGGQKQRLSIARALLHDSGVYIFDEATSNIDIESEEIIMQVIEAMKKDKIVILISHRLANVVNCKCNYVFSHGKLIGNGSHDQLMQENQEYHQLVKTQQEIENYGGKTSEKA
ncbi:cysteine ABC transporter ATP-binding protein [Erysipelatoclostridium sp. An15]|uniref:ABC transporter ATP-binding protein/permease n=1 Tax=Candidatus Erysipelatoclostridium merdavium TaxID=2838566 RepID=A0A9D1XMQ7_9FIRM|nr:ABC transporter ATP-binding protein/permease [Erysipelatoclostridium sp. An15]OUQ09055.1 cysteine ABC transporter ATP-binding protein [Erysipelatoclostridium sp. An15]HIX82343.1 ABC transporter ATP-binding protein/permease [Candidatus Erysipelatoclostridium merdavium]